MKSRVIVILLICSVAFMSRAQNHGTPTNSKVYEASEVDSLPKYRPDTQALFSYIAKNLNYPSDAKEKGVQGKVLAEFIIETDGHVSDVVIVNGLSESCDKEVKRLIASMPANWTPAYKGRKIVRCRFTLPISFRL